MPTDTDSETLADKIRSFRDKAKRKKKKVRADKRAKARRINMEDPDSLSEKIAVKKRRAAEAKEEFNALTEEGKEVAELKFGIGGDGDDSGDDGGLFGALSEAAGSVGDAAENIGETDLSEPLIDDAGMVEPLEEDESIGVVDGPDAGDISLDPAGDDVLMDAGDEDDALDDLDPL